MKMVAMGRVIIGAEDGVEPLAGAGVDDLDGLRGQERAAVAAGEWSFPWASWH